MGSIEEILAGYEALRADQEAFYKDLHEHPELSHQEHRTARRVAERLQGDGPTVQTGIGGTGVVGVLANGSGPVVLLRCELDALPLREDTGARWPSTCCPASPAPWPPARARSCRPRIASRSPCTGEAATAPCRSTPSTRWCSPP